MTIFHPLDTSVAFLTADLIVQSIQQRSPLVSMRFGFGSACHQDVTLPSSDIWNFQFVVWTYIPVPGR